MGEAAQLIVLTAVLLLFASWGLLFAKHRGWASVAFLAATAILTNLLVAALLGAVIACAFWVSRRRSTS